MDLKQPGVQLPGAFDPSLIADLNTVSERLLGMPKYPALRLSNRDTGERFGLEYVEPGCRPVVLDLEKHKTKTTQPVNPAEQIDPPSAQSQYPSAFLDVTPSPHLESLLGKLYRCRTSKYTVKILICKN